jgi:hypothetical protein
MMRLLAISILICSTSHVQAQLWDTTRPASPFKQYVPQQQLDAYNLHQMDISRAGMYTLSVWGFSNILTGAVGAGITHGEAQAFHVSNTIWGSINFVIGVPGVFASYQKSKVLNRSFGTTILQQHGQEKLYLINGALDFAYIGAGAAMWGFSDRVSSQRNKNILSGGGKSFVMQGGFLLLFDWSMYIAQSQHAYRNLNRYISGLSYTGEGFSYSLMF